MIDEHDLAVVSVLSGNRNFEGRINPDVKMNYLASPPLVVAYALAGTMDIDLVNEPLGQDERGRTSTCATSGLTRGRSRGRSRRPSQSDMFRKSYGEVFEGDERWQGLQIPTGDRYAWSDGVDLRAQPAVLHRHGPRAVARCRTSTAPGCSPSSATR